MNEASEDKPKRRRRRLPKVNGRKSVAQWIEFYRAGIKRKRK